ncbi:MAG: hypothetical protein JWN44_5364 [Myxococcales bacterium]|nr:hypothetical protein [Myxococcales bacterium]
MAGSSDMVSGDDMAGGDDLATPVPDMSDSLVAGSAVDTYVTDAADVTKPRDFSSTIIAAWVPANGAFVSRSGTGSTNGTFSIPAVPAGNFYLQIGTRYILTASRMIDLSTVNLGRPDVVRSMANTTATFAVTNLSPWQDGDDGLQFFSRGANLYTYLEGAVNPPLITGDVALSSSQSFYFGGLNLVSGSKGDILYFSQVVHSILPDGTTNVDTTKKVFVPTGFEETSGGNTDASGTLTDVAQALTYSAAWKRSQFFALVGSMGPGATSCADSANLAAQPAFAAHGDFGNSADLITVRPTGNSDFAIQTLAYGNPYPTGFDVVASFAMSCNVNYLPTGATSPATLFPSVSVRGLATMINGTVVPLLSPVTAVKINGVDAATSLSGVGLTPTVTWLPPTLGSPSKIVVKIYKLTTSGTQGTAKLAATVETGIAAVASLSVPPGILEQGSSYALLIEAATGSNSPPFATASVATGTLTP